MKNLAKKKPLVLDFQEGVDRKQLKEVVGRFMGLNGLRLQRTREALGTRQEVVLDMLPLLFHVNHPLLPGYVSRQCPHKISQFEPEREALDAALRHSKTFKYKREARHTPDILSLFLMGSTGSIAQREGSDLDIWLCVREGLGTGERQELEKKCQLITEWADTLGLEVHFFPMSASDFKAGRAAASADEEDCGTAQHFLLLDEFYRSGILLTGCYPLWWLIPSHIEHQYDTWTDWLISNRFINKEEFIDFGSIARIPKGEFVGAGMWQLYKAIDAPYKSVLKLQLTELYAAELPTKFNLSLEFKQQVYRGQWDDVDLDSYVMLYRRLEQYLTQKDQPERRTLARKCFYLKVGEKLSARVSGKHSSWRRDAMQRLVSEWQWGRPELEFLDTRHQWNILQVQTERKIVVNELTHCYRFLAGYTRDNKLKAAINTQDMNLLGRKLYAAFQRKAGKQEFINPNIAPSLAEESLAFHHTSSLPGGDKTPGWLAYRALEASSDAAFFPALRRSNSLIELLVWSHYNGLLVRSTRLGLVPGQADVSMFELKSILSSIQAVMPMPLPPLPQQAFRHQASPVSIMLFVNVGFDPLKRFVEKGLFKLSNRNDSLGYSETRQNLVSTLDQVTLNSWNEVTVNRYELGDTLVQCLKNHLAHLLSMDRDAPRPTVHVFCFDQSRATAISRRVAELFADVEAAFFGENGRLDLRYVIELDQRFFLIEFVEQQPRFTGFDGVIELFTHLSLPQQHSTHLVLDRHALVEKPRLRTVIQALDGQSIQVFYFAQDKLAEVYLVDERGSFFTYSCPFHSESTLLSPLARFLNSVAERRQMRADLDALWSDREVRFYRLEQAGQGKPYRAIDVDVAQLTASQYYFDVQAIGTLGGEGMLHFDIFCEHNEFSHLEYGARLVPAVAHYILSRRKNGGVYPCYITDLGLPHDMDLQEYQVQLQTVQYLQYKHALESALNEAMQDLTQHKV